MLSKAQILVTIWVGKNFGCTPPCSLTECGGCKFSNKGLPGSQVRFCWVRLYVQQKLIEHEMF